MNAKEYFFKKFGTEITVETHPAYYVAPSVYFDLMDEYAKLKETEIWNAAIDAAAEGAMLSIPNGKDCKVISEIEINGEETFELNITVSKQSILNLKK